MAAGYRADQLPNALRQQARLQSGKAGSKVPAAAAEQATLLKTSLQTTLLAGKTAP